MFTTPLLSTRIAAVAAFVATIGDLLLLYFGNARRPELGLPRIDSIWLQLGGVAGFVAIPLYTFGYWAVSRPLVKASPRGAWALFASGAIGSAIGGAIHGLMAWQIGRSLEHGGPAGDPLSVMMDGGTTLLALWGAATALVVIASGIFIWFVARGATPFPRGAALWNPALLTLAIAVAGLPTELTRSFLTPAAPNLAHFIFFVVCAQLLRTQLARASR